MQTRQLGYTDLHLTTIGFGAWAAGGPWAFGWGPQDDDDSIAAIRYALDNGVNWIDTAAVYGIGHSEEVVGKAIAGRRDGVIVATKCGRVLEKPDAPRIIGNLKAAGVRREAENSLRRLGIDVIDLYQIHWPDPDADIEEGWTEIAKLVGEGKIRYAGVSNFSVSQLKRMQAIHPVASLQPPYHMLDRNVETELLPYCAANRIGVVAYSPMASGLLTGKYSPEKIAALADDDWRKRNRRWQEPQLSVNLALVEKLRSIAERHGRTVGQVAVAWVLRRPEVTSAICGARHPRQVAEIITAGDWVLTQDEIAEIERLLAERQAEIEKLNV
jgi:aryl-alcohol dehydrogenase-like predicted oxidoreductase